MTRLDRHIRIAQNKLMLASFVELLAMTLLGLALASWVTIVVLRLAGVHLPGGHWWFEGGIGAAIVVAGAVAGLRRPSRHQAAIAIDDCLALREKFSTALFARGSSDPFARAAVADAEHAAETVGLARRFPVRYPRWGNALVAMSIVALFTAWLMPTFDVLGIQANRQKKAAEATMQRNSAIANAKQALMQLEAAPSSIAETDPIRLARQDLERLLDRPPADAPPIQKRVDTALQKLQAAQQHALAGSTLHEDQLEAVEAALHPPTDDKGPVAEAHRQLQQGKIDQAMDSLTEAVNNFSKMTPQEQQQALQQMSNLAHQIQQQANNPQSQQNMQKQLQKMGASQQQAKQMSQLMQQAAQGNQQASQQLQQMANQMIQQANSSRSGQSQQQQQQTAQAIQQALGQMQQQANRQAQAQQLSQSAQQLAQAMRQASQGQNPGNSGNKSGSNSTAGNQSGGKNPGNSPGNQPGGNQQQTASAGQQMQQALNQLKAMANGAQASAAGQQQQQQQNNGNGPQQVAQARQITSHGYGSEREGLNFRNDPGTVDHKVDPSLAPTDTNPDGRLIASSLVKDNAPIKGDSKASLAKVAAAAEQDTTDEVDEDRIPRSAQNAVKEYFQTLKDNGQN